MVKVYFTGLTVLVVTGLAGVPYNVRLAAAMALLYALGIIAAVRHRRGQTVFPWNEDR
jgi:hypothetical protein